MPDIPRNDELPIMRFDHLGDLEGLIWRREGARLAHLASQVPEGRVIVELGSYKGKSTAYLAAGSKAGAGVKVHAVDLWDQGGQKSPGRKKWGFDEPSTFEAFDAQLRKARCRSIVTAHKGDSVETGRSWDGPPVGLLFIDGYHDTDQVAAEVDAWLPHVDGVVAFHDYGDPRYGVTKFVDQWAKGRTAERLLRVVSVEV